ncbi:MAG TPA: hypothetical protein VKM69_05315 [Natronoarchaeum rubrum]|nr:hypothetical protein [Natronoarchaeum rubrum]
MNPRDRLPAVDRRVVASVVALILLSAALVGAVALAANAFVIDTDQERNGMPYASFQYESQNETIPHGGDANRTTLTITQESGLEIDQENVVVTVNGERAWTVRELDNGSVRIAPVWTSKDAAVEETSARIAVYGDSLNGTVIRPADEVENDPEDGEQTAPPYEFIQPGDVVQVVWRSDDGNKMTVLQRYVVGDPLDEPE